MQGQQETLLSQRQVYEGVDGGCVSRAADPYPEHTVDKTTLRNAGTKSSAPVFAKVKVPKYHEGDEYFFGYPRRGRALIINNMKFVGMPGRPQSVSDEVNLEKIFRDNFGFDVTIHQNLNADEITQVFQREAKADHSAEDCFACAVLTHGGEEMSADNTRKMDVLFGSDGKAVPTENLVNILSDENCPSLEYKPRLFFIQACRGEKTDGGQEVDVYEDKETEGQGATAGGVPDMAGAADEEDESGGAYLSLSRDFLVAYGTTPGQFAFKRKKGSWFVYSFHEAVTQTKGDVSLIDALARAADGQALGFESYSPSNPRFHAKKTVSHITHSLTKKVIFRRKDGMATGP